MRPTIAVITGSLGRPSLEQVRRDVRRQMMPGDEHCVVVGGAYDESHNLALGRAAADWLMFVTDDDLILPGAMNRIRKIVPANPTRMHMFQCIGAGWSAPRIKEWETGGGMCVTPNIPGKVGIWGGRRLGDVDFIRSTLGLLGTEPIWRTEHIVRYNYYLMMSGKPRSVARRREHAMKVRPEMQDERSILDGADAFRRLGVMSSDVVLDLGANIGSFSRPCLDIGCRVIAVEPEPGNYAVLLDNVPEAICIRAAVDRKPGKGRLSLGLSMDHSLHDPPHNKVNGGGRSVQVPCVTLQMLVEGFRPTVIKADIEGSEAHLDWYLEGVRAVLMETHPWVDTHWWPPVFAGWDCVEDPGFDKIAMGVWKR